MLNDLTWDNYLDLNNELIKNSYENVFYTPVQLVQWLCYECKIKFHRIKNCILLYVKFNNEEWKVLNPFYKNNFDYELAYKTIREDMEILNKQCNSIVMSNICQKTIDDWKLNSLTKTKINFVSNYIYELNQLKTYSGNKMQKKRNHLNSFLKQKFNIKVVDIKDVNINDLIIFSEEIIKKYEGEYHQSEIQSYIMTLNDINKCNNYSGITIYIDNKLVAYTLGYLNNETYEIIIEKAIKEIKGLFQFLIKTNLEYNKIDAKFIDRLDDYGLETLRKSKLSYHPIKIIERYDIELI